MLAETLIKRVLQPFTHDNTSSLEAETVETGKQSITTSFSASRSRTGFFADIHKHLSNNDSNSLIELCCEQFHDIASNKEQTHELRSQVEEILKTDLLSYFLAHPTDSTQYWERLLSLPLKLQTRDITLVGKSKKRIENCTLLHVAAYIKEPKLFEVCLRSGFDMQQKNSEGETALHVFLRRNAKTVSDKQLFGILKTCRRHQTDFSLRDKDKKHILTSLAFARKWQSFAFLVAHFSEESSSLEKSGLSVTEFTKLAMYAESSLRLSDATIKRLQNFSDTRLTADITPEPIIRNCAHLLMSALPGIDNVQNNKFNYERLHSLIRRVKEGQSFVTPGVFTRILSEKVAPKGLDEFTMYGWIEAESYVTGDIFHSLCQLAVPDEILDDLISFDVNVNQQASSLYGRTIIDGPLKDQTPAHGYADKGRGKALMKLVDNGADVSLENSDRNTPILAYAVSNRRVDDILIALVEENIHKIDFTRFNKNDVSLGNLHIGEFKIKEVLAPEVEEQVEKKKQELLRRVPAGESFAVWKNNQIVHVDKFELLETVSDLRRELTRKTWSHRTLHENATKGMDSYDEYLYLSAVKELRLRSAQSEFFPLTRLLPRLLFHYDTEKISHIAALTEDTFTYHRGGTAHYPVDIRNDFAVELMTLLSHPKDPNFQDRSVQRLTSALSSYSYFIGRRRRVNSTCVNVWSRTARISFGFLRQRFEAERYHSFVKPGVTESQPAILEEFGMLRVPERSTDKDENGKDRYGTGYLLTPDSDAWHFIDSWRKKESRRMRRHCSLEWRRAYKIITDKEYGTLIVRNSSIFFGRNALPQAGYWSPKYLTPEELRNFNFDNPECKEKFFSLLDREIFHSMYAAEKLAEQLLSFEDAFDAWKFNTGPSAWRKTSDGETFLAGGYHSPGFRHIVTFLERRMADIEQEKLFHGSSNKVMPDLAFHNPHYPPLVPLVRFRVDSDIIAILKKLATEGEGSVTESEYTDSQLRDFFNKGFSTRSTLSLIAGK